MKPEGCFMKGKQDIAINVEPATEQDLDQILELQKKAFYGQAVIYNDFNLPPLSQTLNDLKKEFREKNIYKTEKDEQIIGSVRCHIKDKALHIEKLIVDPAFQNRGIGTNLMMSLENKYAQSVARFEIFTGHKSQRNLHLYKKLGYLEMSREVIRDDLILIHMEKINAKG